MEVSASSASASASNADLGYIVSTVESPSAVFHSLYANFLGPQSHDLVISKTNRLEIYHITTSGLQAKLQIPLNGRVTALKALRPGNSLLHYLLVTVEKEKYCVLKYDAGSGSVLTVESGDFHDPACRPVERGPMMVVDPAYQFMALHSVQGLVKAIPFDNRVKESIAFKEPLNKRIDELQVLDVQFLLDTPPSEPILAILYETVTSTCAIRTYNINTPGNDFKDGPWKFEDLEMDSHTLIPVPSPKGGVLVLADESIFYYNATDKAQCAVAMQPTRITCHCRIDENGYRYLLADSTGNLYVLILFGEDSLVQSLKLEYVGKTVIASTISYLDSGYIYIGSHFGDCQIVKLSSKRLDDGTFVQVVDTIPGLAPIVDFVPVDLENIGQSSVVACCGAYKEGSVRTIRKGAHLNISSAIEIELDIKELFFMPHPTDSSTGLLFASTFFETRILQIKGDEITELSTFDNLALREPSLFVGKIGNNMVQVTKSEASFKYLAGTVQRIAWKPTDHGDIVFCLTIDSCLAVVTDANELLWFNCDEITKPKPIKLSGQVSAISLCKLKGSYYAIVSFWNHREIMAVNFATGVVSALNIQINTLVRSISVATFEESHPYILLGLGDGSLIYCSINGNFECGPQQKAVLGKSPVILKGVHTHLFALSDRPYVISFSKGHLSCNLTNAKDVHNICACIGSDQIALLRDQEILFATLDGQSKLQTHHQSYPMQETATRILHNHASKTFVVLGTDRSSVDWETEDVTSRIRLLDQDLMTQIDEFILPKDERAHSVSSLYLVAQNVDAIIVGTAKVTAPGQEPQNGRILTFSINQNRRLQLLSETSVPGCVYATSALDGKLVAAVNGMTSLYAWSRTEGGESFTWRHVHSHFGQIIGVRLDVFGEFIAVGDLMKSVNIIRYDPLTETLVEIARDYEAHWMTEVKFLDGETILGADNLGNIFVMRKRRDLNAAREQWRLEVKSGFHLGEVVNRIAKGTMARQISLNETASSSFSNPHLIGTTCGSILMIAQVAPECYKQLEILQRNLNRVISPIGGISHSEWRQLATERRRPSTVPTFLDGDLLCKFLELPDNVQKIIVEGDRPTGCECTGSDLKLITEIIQNLVASQ